MIKEKLLQENEKLLYKQSWYYAHKYEMDFEDVKSQAFLIFCEALERFDSSKASFTTYLFHRLRTLNDYCRKEKNLSVMNKSFSQQIFNRDSQSQAENSEGVIYNFEENLLNKIVFYQALENLSGEGKQVVYAILRGGFENPESLRKRTIGKFRIKSFAKKKWGWDYEKASRIYDEVENWWKKV